MSSRKHPFLLLTLCLLVLLPLALQAQEPPDAVKLINALGCKACHALAGEGGTLAASFAEMRQNLSRTAMQAALVGPEGQHGNSRIADFSYLTTAERATLLDFMQSADADPDSLPQDK
ncbi:MAG: hypothetical protein P8Y91_01820 [Desulfuromonadales bacterium]|jgi:hypothetical protein